MKSSVVDKVVVPLIVMRNSVLIAISTPDGEDNFYSVLLEKKDAEGNMIFKVLAVGLACTGCKNRGMAAQCTHETRTKPAFHDPEAAKIQKMMVGDQTYAAEQMGVINKSGKSWTFDPAAVEAAFAIPRVKVEGSGGVVFLSVDPAGGGGGKSEFAMVAFVLDGENRVVVCIFISFLFVYVFCGAVYRKCFDLIFKSK